MDYKDYKLPLRYRLWLLIRSIFSRFRIDLCAGENDGFDVGAFVGTWKASWGPFLLHRQCGMDTMNPGDYGPWRLMIALSPKAWVGFDDGACG